MILLWNLKARVTAVRHDVGRMMDEGGAERGPVAGRGKAAFDAFDLGGFIDNPAIFQAANIHRETRRVVECVKTFASAGIIADLYDRNGRHLLSCFRCFPREQIDMGLKEATCSELKYHPIIAFPTWA